MGCMSLGACRVSPMLYFALCDEVWCLLGPKRGSHRCSSRACCKKVREGKGKVGNYDSIFNIYKVKGMDGVE